MTKKIPAVALAMFLTAAALPSPAATSARVEPPRRISSPPGQVVVMTVNAHQVRILGLKRFISMLELSKAMRGRPEAFDGGKRGAVTSPDVVIVQEIRPTNVEIFDRLLRQRFGVKYRIAGRSDTSAVIIYNDGTLELQSSEVWADVCTSPDTPSDGRSFREYPIARFTERATGAPVTIAGIHLAKNYRAAGGPECTNRNVEELRTRLDAFAGPTIVGGDFNKRAVTVQHECDPHEESAPMQWWLDLTAPVDGSRAFADAVRIHHRLNDVPLRYEWTHEQTTRNHSCNGDTGIRRTRIDYLFAADAIVAEAHADHPGWASRVPGGRHPHNFKYSDHRWVWGRFVVSGPLPVPPPEIGLEIDGGIRLSWPPTDGVPTWMILRGLRGEAYEELVELPGDTVSYTDNRTDHGVDYRYALVPIGADGGHGLASPPVRAQADARGPRVVAVDPGPGRYGVDPGTKLTVRFNEGILPGSVDDDVIRIYHGFRRVFGHANLRAPRVIRFNPRSRLRGGTTFRVIVSGVRDKVENLGPRFTWRFTTRGRR